MCAFSKGIKLNKIKLNVSHIMSVQGLTYIGPYNENLYTFIIDICCNHMYMCVCVYLSRRFLLDTKLLLI